VLRSLAHELEMADRPTRCSRFGPPAAALGSQEIKLEISTLETPYVKYRLGPNSVSRTAGPIASMLRYAEARLKHRAFLTAAEVVTSQDRPRMKSEDLENGDRLNPLKVKFTGLTQYSQVDPAV
jgi:hypothetical protein